MGGGCWKGLGGAGGGEGRLKESLHPLNHQPPFFLLQFFKTCLFLCLVSLEFFSLFFFLKEKAGRLVGKEKERGEGGSGEKACGDGEAALCRLNGAIVRRGGGEENGSPGTEGV